MDYTAIVAAGSEGKIIVVAATANEITSSQAGVIATAIGAIANRRIIDFDLEVGSLNSAEELGEWVEPVKKQRYQILDY